MGAVWWQKIQNVRLSSFVTPPCASKKLVTQSRFSVKSGYSQYTEVEPSRSEHILHHAYKVTRMEPSEGRPDPTRPEGPTADISFLGIKAAHILDICLLNSLMELFCEVSVAQKIKALRYGIARVNVQFRWRSAGNIVRSKS